VVSNQTVQLIFFRLYLILYTCVVRFVTVIFREKFLTQGSLARYLYGSTEYYYALAASLQPPCRWPAARACTARPGGHVMVTGGALTRRDETERAAAVSTD
jgi:hypothetical protein